MIKNLSTLKKLVFAFMVLSLFSVVGCKGKNSEAKKEKSTAKVEKSSSLKPNAEKDFKYTLTEDGTGVKITEYIGSSSKIIIPDTIEGIPVKEVEKLANRDTEYGELYWNSWVKDWVYPKCNDKITHVSFPDSVEHVPSGLLSKYFALKYVKLSANLDKNFFSEEPKFNEVLKVIYTTTVNYIIDPETNKKLYGYDPRGYDVYKYTVDFATKILEDCTNLETVIIPEGLSSIPSSTFSNCKSLKEIKLPSTIKYIGSGAFYGCENLSKIEIPENIKLAFNTYSRFIEYVKPEAIEFSDTEPQEYKASGTFAGTNFDLTTQAKLKSLGYDGEF